MSMNDYLVVPIEEHEQIKLKKINAKSERGALMKFAKIWGVRGKIHKFDKLTFTGDKSVLNGKRKYY